MLSGGQRRGARARRVEPPCGRRLFQFPANLGVTEAPNPNLQGSEKLQAPRSKDRLRFALGFGIRDFPGTRDMETRVSRQLGVRRFCQGHCLKYFPIQKWSRPQLCVRWKQT